MNGYKANYTDEQKEQIIKDFTPFIKYTAYRLGNRIPPQLTIDDLVSVGIMGLLDAMGSYEPSKAKLKTFAEFRIKGAMLDELRAFDPAPRSLKEKSNEIKKTFVELERELQRTPEDEEVAARLKITLDEYFKTLGDVDGIVTLRFEDFQGKSDGDDGMDLLSNMPDTKYKDPLASLEEASKKGIIAKQISEMPEKEKMVLSLYYWDELTMKEIGKVLGLSEGRVCQLHSQAVHRLKGKVELELLRQ
jgi:RNA polymerase sigma factor for flagellar operon FliA